MAQPIPSGFTSITPYLLVSNVVAQIDFLRKAFSGMVSHSIEMTPGQIGHAEMSIFGSKIMMGQARPPHVPMPMMIYLYVAECDAIHAAALAAGGVVDQPVADQFYGDRSGSVKDSNGNIWWIGTHKEDLTADQIRERMKAMRPG